MMNIDLRTATDNLNRVASGALANGAVDPQPANTPMANNRLNYLNALEEGANQLLAAIAQARNDDAAKEA